MCSMLVQALVPLFATIFYACYFGARYLYSRWHLRRSKLQRARGQSNVNDHNANPEGKPGHDGFVDEMVGEIDEKLPIGAIGTGFARSTKHLHNLCWSSFCICASFLSVVCSWLSVSAMSWKYCLAFQVPSTFIIVLRVHVFGVGCVLVSSIYQLSRLTTFLLQLAYRRYVWDWRSSMALYGPAVRWARTHLQPTPCTYLFWKLCTERAKQTSSNPF